METKLNIAEILKDKPKGTKLYSPLFGNVYFSDINNSTTYVLHHTSMASFYSDATFIKFEEAEPLLFPSKEMRDWSKFAWKKGDVLVSNNGTVEVIFDCFDDSTYASFKGKHALKTIEGESEYIGDSDDDYGVFYTGNYLKESEAPAQTYIKTIEKKLGGKLNLETLEIKNTQPEFKDGDIVTATSDFDSIFIGVLKKNIKDFPNNELRFYCALENKKLLAFDGLEVAIKAIKTSLATEKEKQLLFSALAMGGKTWDAEKKEIVDLKIKWTPKTFDRVITRDFDDGVWSANIFSHMNSQGEYVSIGCVEGYAYCLPYNEETAKLIGTTNNAK